MAKIVEFIPNFSEGRDQSVVDAISADTSLVCIDRPNNPTGQTLTLAEVEQILARCEQLGVYCIVDEAYGDFIPREESAVTLGPKYKNIIIVRTFSKGFGLVCKIFFCEFLKH